ncbi:hypothetical protein [Acinetobacter sp. ANC 3813]|uniref:hypothetical protein n=1 Tax=Acinetobacter sp. ANC 3813 TaxID=1977873 RepID=UPI000A346D70|nr:hypothetical protein [Acinetobacter sp. ANC 3813]OTG89036.1 hypothetical protein B9T34_12545 [Acinetobacter sp. ANC 3813]
MMIGKNFISCQRSASNGLGALKSNFPSQEIYKVRLNADSTLLPINHVQAYNPSWLLNDKKEKIFMRQRKPMLKALFQH